jgi:hypothetical protein
VQNDHGADNNRFDGSLDAVARHAMAEHAKIPVALMLDVHIESDPARTPGVFPIGPDGNGLRTLTPSTGTDHAVPWSRDRQGCPGRRTGQPQVDSCEQRGCVVSWPVSQVMAKPSSLGGCGPLCQPSPGKHNDAPTA